MNLSAEISARLVKLQQQRDSALTEVVLMAGRVAMLEEEVAALKKAREIEPLAPAKRRGAA